MLRYSLAGNENYQVTVNSQGCKTYSFVYPSKGAPVYKNLHGMLEGFCLLLMLFTKFNQQLIMEKVIKILAAVTGTLVAIGEVLNQANKYVELKKSVTVKTLEQSGSNGAGGVSVDSTKSNLK